MALWGLIAKEGLGQQSCGDKVSLTTSYDKPTYTTQAGGHSSPDDKSSPRGTDEHPFEHPSRSCFSDRCGHEVTKERDLALRRVDELHSYYKKELQKKDDADRTATLIGMEQRQIQIRAAQKETEQYKIQFEQAMSLVETQKLSIKLHQDELGEEAEFDAEETAQMRSVRRECETRFNNYEDRKAQLQSDMQVYQLKKVTKERDDARAESNELQQSAKNMFNELQQECHIADEEAAAAERVTVLADLRSLLELRNQQLNDMERSRVTIEKDRTSVQLHSTEVQVTIVSLRRELDEARANALTARASEEAARLQITRMMNEQLVQNQTIEALRRQVESSNTSAQQAQALLRANQEQQSQMSPPHTTPSGAGGVIGNTSFIQPLSTPSTGFRTREFHGPGYYHIGSPADQGYAEHMCAMFGRDDMGPPRQEPPRQEQQSMGSF